MSSSRELPDDTKGRTTTEISLGPLLEAHAGLPSATRPPGRRNRRTDGRTDGCKQRREGGLTGQPVGRARRGEAGVWSRRQRRPVGRTVVRLVDERASEREVSGELWWPATAFEMEGRAAWWWSTSSSQPATSSSLPPAPSPAPPHRSARPRSARYVAAPAEPRCELVSRVERRVARRSLEFWGLAELVADGGEGGDRPGSPSTASADDGPRSKCKLAGSGRAPRVGRHGERQSGKAREGAAEGGMRAWAWGHG